MQEVRGEFQLSRKALIGEDETQYIQRQLVERYARAALGKRYQQGGSGPDTFDEAGFCWAALHSAGIEISKDTFLQFGNGTEVDLDSLEPGDLVFFCLDGCGLPCCSGVSVGGLSFVGSFREHGVALFAITHLWRERFVGARRWIL